MDQIIRNKLLKVINLYNIIQEYDTANNDLLNLINEFINRFQHHVLNIVSDLLKTEIEEINI